jgi:hypothetical protein
MAHGLPGGDPACPVPDLTYVLCFRPRADPVRSPRSSPTVFAGSCPYRPLSCPGAAPAAPSSTSSTSTGASLAPGAPSYTPRSFSVSIMQSTQMTCFKLRASLQSTTSES